MDRRDVDGDVVIVTGASGGLGREMALRFSREGANVVLVARTEEKLESIAESAPGETLVSPTDIRNQDDIQATIDRTLDTFGRIDAIVNNAAVGLLSLEDRPMRTDEVSKENWDTILETNLRGPFLFLQTILPQMVEQGHGNVINVTSGLSKQTVPGWGPYTASKFGLKGLTETMAIEYDDDGINVNLLYPGGLVDTGFWDHISSDENAAMLPPDVMNDAAVLLAEQGPHGITGKSMQASSWEHTFQFNGAQQ